MEENNKHILFLGKDGKMKYEVIEDLAKLEEDLLILKNNTNGLGTDLVELKGKSSLLETGIETLKTNTEGLEVNIGNVNTGIERLENDLAEIKNNTNSLGLKSDQIKLKIDEMRSILDLIKERTEDYFIVEKAEYNIVNKTYDVTYSTNIKGVTLLSKDIKYGYDEYGETKEYKTTLGDSNKIQLKLDDLGMYYEGIQNLLEFRDSEGNLLDIHYIELYVYLMSNGITVVGLSEMAFEVPIDYELFKIWGADGNIDEMDLYRMGVRFYEADGSEAILWNVVVLSSNVTERPDGSYSLNMDIEIKNKDGEPDMFMVYGNVVPPKVFKMIGYNFNKLDKKFYIYYNLTREDIYLKFSNSGFIVREVLLGEAQELGGLDLSDIGYSPGMIQDRIEVYDLEDNLISYVDLYFNLVIGEIPYLMYPSNPDFSSINPFEPLSLLELESIGFIFGDKEDGSVRDLSKIDFYSLAGNYLKGTNGTTNSDITTYLNFVLEDSDGNKITSQNTFKDLVFADVPRPETLLEIRDVSYNSEDNTIDLTVYSYLFGFSLSYNNVIVGEGKEFPRDTVIKLDNSKIGYSSGTRTYDLVLRSGFHSNLETIQITVSEV